MSEQQKLFKHGGFSWRILEQVFNKTNGACYYCGTIFPPDVVVYLNIDGEENFHGYKRQWDVDHMLPISRGGNHKIENLVPACKSCNNKKSSMTVQEFMEVLKS